MTQDGNPTRDTALSSSQKAAQPEHDAALCDVAAPAVPCSHAFWVAFFAGLLGLYRGIATGQFHAPIENAQVLAGIVKYPDFESFYYIYELRLWTLVNQIAAALLYVGVPERWLAMLISATVGVLMFQALALCTLSVSRNRWLAVLVPACMSVVDLTSRLTVSYQIDLVNSPHTYGMMGNAVGLLALSLLALGRTRTGLVILGLAPGVHPSVGVWCVGIAALAAMPQWRSARTFFLRGDGRFLVLALGFAALSFAWQSWASRDVPRLDAAEATRYVRAYVQYYDFHRSSVALHSLPRLRDPIVLTFTFALTCGLWLCLHRRDVGPPAGFLLRALIISATLGIAMVILTRWTHYLPLWLVASIPGRFINLTSFAMPAVVAGMVGRYARRPLPALLLEALSLAVLWEALRIKSFSELRDQRLWTVWWFALFMAVVVVMFLHHLKYLRGGDAWRWASIPGAIAVAAVLLALIPRSEQGGLFDWRVLLGFSQGQGGLFDGRFMLGFLALAGAGMMFRPGRSPPLVPTARPWPVTLALGLALCGGGLTVGHQLSTHWSHRLLYLRDWTTDPLLEWVHDQPGMVLTTTDASFIQTMTRRPVLCDSGAQWSVAYFPEVSPALERYFRTYYDEDLFHPTPKTLSRTGDDRWREHKELWEKRSPEMWRDLARQHDFHVVVTERSWQLHLPLVGRLGWWAFYSVPDHARQE